TCGTISYPIELRPETDVALGELLRRLPPVLAGGEDPAGQLSPDALLQKVGVCLWQALIPDTARDQRAGLADLLSGDITPLLLVLPTAIAALPWELLCDPHATGDNGFLARRRPLARLVSSGAELPPIAPPLRVLLLISSPLDIEEHRRVDVESERAAVEEATR